MNMYTYKIELGGVRTIIYMFTYVYITVYIIGSLHKIVLL